MEFESLEINDEVRNKSYGSFIKLQQGHVHYQLEGDSKAPVVVFVPGFSVPMFVWDHNYNVVKDAGFRVLRYNLFGRGFSDRPDVKYGPELFDSQLLQLLDKLDLLANPVNIVGLSMGGAITINFVDRHPDLIAKMVLFDPAGFPQEMEFKKRLLSVPGLNKLIFKIAGHKTLINGWTSNFRHPERFLNFEARFKEQMEYKGYANAIVSTYQNMNMFDMVDVYERVGKTEIPKQLFWGTEDEVIPFNQSEKVLKALPGTEFHALDDTGHNSNYESANIVNPLLIDFLKR